MLPDGTHELLGVIPGNNATVTVDTTTGTKHVAVIDGLAIVRDIGVLSIRYRRADGTPTRWY